jgi:hypothetical protein
MKSYHILGFSIVLLVSGSSTKAKINDAFAETVFVTQLEMNKNQEFSCCILLCRNNDKSNRIYEEDYFWFSQASLSPDNSRLAFYSYPLPSLADPQRFKTNNMLEVKILELSSQKTISVFKKKIESGYVPLPSDPWGEWKPQWSPDGKYLYVSIPFGQDSSGIKFAIWKLRLDSGDSNEVPFSDATCPACSPDGKWMFYCQIPLKGTIGAIRDQLNCSILDLNDNSNNSKLPSRIIEAPLRAVFSQDSKTLAVFCRCNVGADDWPVVEYCIELFRLEGGRWGLLNRLTLKQIETILNSGSHQQKKLTLFLSYGGNFGLSLNPDGSVFTMFVQETDRIEAGSARFYLYGFNTADINKGMKILYKEDNAVPFDAFIRKDSINVVLQKRKDKKFETFLKKVPIK